MQRCDLSGSASTSKEDESSVEKEEPATVTMKKPAGKTRDTKAKKGKSKEEDEEVAPLGFKGGKNDDDDDDQDGSGAEVKPKRKRKAAENTKKDKTKPKKKDKKESKKKTKSGKKRDDGASVSSSSDSNDEGDSHNDEGDPDSAVTSNQLTDAIQRAAMAEQAFLHHDSEHDEKAPFHRQLLVTQCNLMDRKHPKIFPQACSRHFAMQDSLQVPRHPELESFYLDWELDVI